MVLEFFRNVFGVASPFVKFPVVKADDDDDDDEGGPIDQAVGLRANCSKSERAQALLKRLDDCNTRVRSRSKTEETCEEEVHDLFHFLDHCVAKDLFKYLK